MSVAWSEDGKVSAGMRLPAGAPRVPCLQLPSGSAPLPDYAQQANFFANTLEEAAMALRRQIQPLDRCSQYSGISTPQISKCATPPVNGTGQQPRPSMAEVMPMTPGSQVDIPFGASTGGASTDDAIVQQLLQENASLRDAFSEASRRLARIEDDKSRFFDEGIFDLVNSVCGQSGSTGSCDDLVSRFRRQWPNRPSADASEAHTPVGSMMGPILSSSSDISMSLGAGRSCDDQRAAELSGENAELRRELEQASKVSEALEWQQRAAEERTHDLEEERLHLVERLRCHAKVATSGSPRGRCTPPLSAASYDPPAGSDEWHQHVSRLLQAELELAEDRARPCRTPPSETERILDLERKLRETESRAEVLATENSRLQSQDEVRTCSPREFSMPAEFNASAVTVAHSLADMNDQANDCGAGASPLWTPAGVHCLAPPESALAVDAVAEAVEAAPLEALQIDEAW